MFEDQGDAAGSMMLRFNPLDAKLFFVKLLLLLSAELIFANLHPGAGLFWRLENVAILSEL